MVVTSRRLAEAPAEALRASVGPRAASGTGLIGSEAGVALLGRCWLIGRSCGKRDGPTTCRSTPERSPELRDDPSTRSRAGRHGLSLLDPMPPRRASTGASNPGPGSTISMSTVPSPSSASTPCPHRRAVRHLREPHRGRDRIRRTPDRKIAGCPNAGGQQMPARREPFPPSVFGIEEQLANRARCKPGGKRGGICFHVSDQPTRMCCMRSADVRGQPLRFLLGSWCLTEELQHADH